MALPLPSRLTRDIPGGGTEDVRGITVYDEVEGGTSPKLPAQIQFPALVWKIGHQLSTAGGHVGREFPDDGTGILPANPLGGGNSTLKLASGVLQSQQATLDPRNLLVMIVTGSCAGQVRRITGWTSGTQVLTVNRDWVTPFPQAADKYRLLVDLRYREHLQLATEYSADQLAASFRVILYDWAMDGAELVRKPRRVYDLERQSYFTARQISDAADIESTNRWPGETVPVTTKGFLGAKVQLTVAPGGGDVDLFVAST